MNAIASFAPVLTLSLGSLGYLVGGQLLERARISALFALILIGAAGYLSLGLLPAQSYLEHALIITPFTRFFAVLACAGAFVSILGTASSIESEKIEMLSEYYFLMVTSLCGALVMIFAGDLLTLFIGVEVASLALYCLCGARVTVRASSESSLKYFLLGCVSSSFMLFGIALWYGVTGSLLLSELALPALAEPLGTLSFLLILIGLAFKIGLAPFHQWIPDVYQGAPTSVTTYMSCVVKVAAFAALFKISDLAFQVADDWFTGTLWVLAVVAMCVGNLAALQQRSVKRMLAYSSVAQAGYIMIGLVILDSDPTAGGVLASSVFYLTVYCAMTVGAFTVLSILGPDVDDIQELKGLVRRSPYLGVAMTLFFLGLAGLPPSLAGLLGKVYLFSGALSAEFYGLGIIAALNSALACAYYFRVPAAILFQEPLNKERVNISAWSALALAVCLAVVVGVGVVPEKLLKVCASTVDPHGVVLSSANLIPED
jgi:NADH-quinone oxidoreductase subunit N